LPRCSVYFAEKNTTTEGANTLIVLPGVSYIIISADAIGIQKYPVMEELFLREQLLGIRNQAVCLIKTVSNRFVPKGKRIVRDFFWRVS
jgi:hypothetical protein